MLRGLERVGLGHFPTPIEELKRLGGRLGRRVYVKRDDLTGLATGGNKTRKLEFLLAEALAQNATTLITTGAVQSNHARQTAAAAAHCGLRCVLVLGGLAPPAINGNLLIDRLVGAHVAWAGDRSRERVMDEVARSERAAGRVPYVIPYGGSSPLGAVGYVQAMDELARQLIDRDLHVDWIVHASSSGGTQAGLVVGARAAHFSGHILGISVDKPARELVPHVQDLALRTADRAGFRFEIDPDTVQVNDAYLGAGYGVLGEVEREAIALLARSEGLLLDPVYTGRAMAGMLDLCERGQFGQEESILFWHTGGTAGIFAYADVLGQMYS